MKDEYDFTGATRGRFYRPSTKEDLNVSIPKPLTKIAGDAGSVAAQIVSVLDASLLPAGDTRLELKTCEDGTFLLTTPKPAAAPIGVGFRITATDLITLRELLRVTLDKP